MAKKRSTTSKPTNPTDDAGRMQALESTLNDLTKRFGDGTIIRLNDENRPKVDAIPTGSLGVDICVGVGGVPRGRVTEIYGPESSGKTTLCLHIIAEAQKRGGICAFVDMEHALDPAYAERIGVSLDDLFVSQPDTGEQALEITESLVRSGALDVVVVDSVAALVPRAEIEGEMGDSHVGLQARLMSQALRKLTGAIKHSNTVVLFTNQLREKVGIMFGCFGYQAPVLLADGTTMPIGVIVNQKLPVEVLSWNEKTGCFEPKRVVSWFKNGVDVDEFTLSDNEVGTLEQDFMTLIARYPDGSDFTKVTCTPNHQIATPKGFTEAMYLDLGDKMLARHEAIQLNRDLEQILIGSMLGDGSIRKKSHMTAYFCEEHGVAQAEYVHWKADMFGDLVSQRHQSEDRVGFATRSLSALTRYKELFYGGKGRYKHINPDILRRLTPLALAIWYQDDGTLDTTDRRRHTIAIHKISDEERLMIEGIFADLFNLRAKVYKQGSWSRITFNGDDSDRFEALIAPYVHPSMAYKLRQQEGVGNELANLQPDYCSQFVALPCEIYEIRYLRKQGREAVRYNLEVEDNSTYIVGQHAIVHNSPETTPGGRALKFYASVRLDIRRIQSIKAGGDTVGNRTRVKVKKNKVAAPFKECEFDIMFHEGDSSGISKVGEIVDIGVELGVIEKRGAFFRYNEEMLGQGRENAKQFLRENPAMSNAIENIIRQQFGLPIVEDEA